MTQSSSLASAESEDKRDKLGYAIRELEAGVADEAGELKDAIVHKASRAQTLIYVSSTDPWHREKDRDDKVEQPGFDMLVKSGLTRGLPFLAPVPIVYDTPENAAAEVSFLRSRGFDVPRIEMGEEPDGQKIDPADYAALYMRWADAIHGVVPKEELGGPSFVALDYDKHSDGWEYGSGWWLRRFLDCLQERHRAHDFRFLSFEWYPFDDVWKPTAPQIVKAPGMLKNAFALMRRNGMSRKTPVVVTEYGYSAFAGEAEVSMAGALSNADTAGLFLMMGGEKAYMYGYEPNYLQDEYGCNSWGNNMLFLQNKSGGIRSRIATYHAARMLTSDWVVPAGGLHWAFKAESNVSDADGDALVSGYPLLRPDHEWSLMLINKDPAKSYSVTIRLARDGMKTPLQGPYEISQLSAKEYAWHADGAHGYAARSEPPRHWIEPDAADARFLLPAYSLTVVRGRAGNAGLSPLVRRSASL